MSTIVYFHVPKCAGTTITEFFARKFGHDAVLTRTTTLDYLVTPSNFMHGYKVYAGHVSYDCVPLLPRDSLYVTVLRNPYERLISLYRYYRGLDATLYHPESARLAKAMDFHDWLECKQINVINETRNAVLRRFVPDSFFRNPSPACPHNMLKVAEDFVSDFRVLGFVEELCVTKTMLSQAFALPLNADDLEINMNVSEGSDLQYSRDRLKRFVEEFSWLDLEFTRHCVSIFRRQCPVEHRRRLDDLELRVFG